MRAVLVIWILFCTFLAQTYPDSPSFIACCSYKQPKKNQSIASKADVIVGEKMFRHKTFFSAEWSRKKVISKIYEAYQEFIMSGRGPILRPDGKYFLSGWTSEGIEIEMFITKKGLIKTAYPVLKK